MRGAYPLQLDSRLPVKSHLDRAHQLLWALGSLLMWMNMKFPPLFTLLCIFFSRVGETKVRVEPSGWGRGNDAKCLPRLLPRGVRWCWGWKVAGIKRAVFSFPITWALPIPLLSVPSQQVPAWGPRRWRQAPPSAANPAEGLLLSGQELKRKTLQAFTTAAIWSFNQPQSPSLQKAVNEIHLCRIIRHQWARTEHLFFAASTILGPQVGLSYFLIRVSKSVWFSHNSQQPGARAFLSAPFSETCHSQLQANLYVAMASPFICLYILWTAWIYHIIFIWKTENGGFIAIQSDYGC